MKKYLRLGIYFILFAILIATFVYLGQKDFKKDDTSDSIKFAKEYDIDSDNPFVYTYSSEVIDIIKNSTGIIYMGFSSNDWSKAYIKYLYPILKDNNIEKVYYYDILKDRTKYSKKYQELEKLLSDYLYEMDSGSLRLSTPALVFVKNGKIMHFDDETAIERNNTVPSSYWIGDKIFDFTNKIDSYLKEVNYNE